MIFETHAHYDDDRFAEDRRAVLLDLPGKGISPVINVGASIESVETTLALAHEYDFVYAAVGVHPSDIVDLNEESFAWLRERTKDDRCVAVGEIGLDYYWDKETEVQEKQRYWFKRQLSLAEERQLPVIIHSRDAAEDTLRIMQMAHEKGIRGVIHCYSYSPELAHEFAGMGYYIGVGGVVTFKNAKKLVRTVEEIPLTRILLETDCPYMAPEPHRGTRNDSRNIPYVIEKIAQIKGVSPQEVEETTRENAFQLFHVLDRTAH
jgi:TatD DNase family protein